MAKLQQRGETVLEPYKSHRECVMDLVWPRVCHLYLFRGRTVLTWEQSDRECRILIDMAIMPAVVEAQKHQSTSPITIAFNTGSRQTKPDERLLIVQDYQVPAGKNGETFHELIDYVILLVPRDSYCTSNFLQGGSAE